MKTTKLSRAIRLILAANVGVATFATLPVALAQQAPMQPMPAYQYPAGQGQVVYAQPQGVAPTQVPNVVYAQPQQAYQPAAAPQGVYAQPPVVAQQQFVQQPIVQQPLVQQPLVQQPMVQPPIAMQTAPRSQWVQTPQGVVMYQQPPVPTQAPAQAMPYGNVLMQQPASMYVQPAYPQSGYPQAVMPPRTVVVQQSSPQANMMMVQTPNGLVYAYPAQPPQGVVMYQGPVAYTNAAGQVVIANNGAAAATAEALDLNSPDVTPRLQTGSAGKPASGYPNQPTQTLTAEALRQVNTVNVEDALNTLPQVIPGLGRTSNNPGNGRAEVDLRGLGSERTAVLVNGRPFAPSGSSGVVDLNAIPNALVKQVEVTTGGSSVAHGSGAIAGAVNFVLDEDYQGVEFNVSHQSTPERDAGLSSADLTLGTDFAEGRGNFAVSVGASEREALTQGEREATAFALFDDIDANGNPILINGGSSGVPGTSIFSGAFANFAPDSFGVTFDENGQIRPFNVSQNSDENDFYNYASTQYLQLPQTREHATVLGSFELADAAELYGLGMYSSTRTDQQLAPAAVFFSGTQFTLDESPFLTASSQQILSDALGDGIDTDGDGIDDTATAFIRRRMNEVGPRRFESETLSEYVQGGLRGDIGGVIEYDVYASRSNVENSVVQTGGISRSRFVQAQLLNLDADPSGTVCQDDSPNDAGVACTPANIFGPGNISPEAAEFLATETVINRRYEQSIQGARLTGKIGSLPGGDARITVGAERRQDDYVSTFEIENGDPAGSNFGFNTFQPIDGQTSSESVYGDIYIPVASNAAGAELIDLELGYRLTDHSAASEFASYGAALSFAPSEFVKFRAAYNVAHRAPNIAELFVPQSESFPGASDPCSASGVPFGGLTPAQIDTCIATGVPPELVGSSALNPPSGQVRALSGGNPDLDAEMAETFTAGLQVGVPLGDEGFIQVGGDYFVIDGSDAIERFGGGAANVLNNCYAAVSSSNEASPFCEAINRNADGTIESIELTQQNVAMFNVEGVDLFAGVSLPVLGGTLGVDFNGTVLDKQSFTAFEGAETVECAGRFGNLCGGPIPEYSHRLTAGWNADNLTAAIIWRHIGEVTDDNDGVTFFRETINARDYFDAEVSLDFADSIGLSIGVQNLTDVAPPVIGDNQEQANTYPATYDTFGRTYFVRVTGSSSLDGK